MIDFHTHILPKMDDGSSSNAESIQMLQRCYETGVETVILSPHYSSYESIDSFLYRREDSFNNLQDALKGVSNIPKMLLAAEVEFYSGISSEKKISKLCIGNTNYLLLEMPFVQWTSLMIKEVQSLIITRGIIPIIAHLDRYLNDFGNSGIIDSLLNLGVLVQINAEALQDKRLKGRILKMIKAGSVQLIGSDCHDANKRPPNMSLAKDVIQTKLGAHELKNIQDTGQRVLNGETVSVLHAPQNKHFAKKTTRIALLIILALLILFAVLKHEYISSIYLFITNSSEQLETKIQQNEHERQALLEGIPVRSLTEEESEAIACGKLSESAAINGLAEENSANSNTVNDDYEEAIAAQMAKLYYLEAKYSGVIDGLAASAKEEYMALPKEQHTDTNKWNIGVKYLNIALSNEAECDSQVAGVISEIEGIVKEHGGDKELPGKIKSYYASQKSLKKAYYMSLYS